MASHSDGPVTGSMITATTTVEHAGTCGPAAASACVSAARHATHTVLLGSRAGQAVSVRIVATVRTNDGVRYSTHPPGPSAPAATKTWREEVMMTPPLRRRNGPSSPPFPPARFLVRAGTGGPTAQASLLLQVRNLDTTFFVDVGNLAVTVRVA